MVKACWTLILSKRCPRQDRCPFNHDLPYCAICDWYALNSAKYDEHLAQPSHVEKSRKYENRVARDHAERDKGGIMITPGGGVDFGLVEYKEASAEMAAYQPSRFIKITSGDTKVVLQRITLRDSSVASAQDRHFSVEKLAQPETLPPHHYREISVHFQPRNEIGTYEDTLLIDFIGTHDGRGRQEMTIERSVRGAVGIKNDVSNFQAKTPYVKVDYRKQPRAHEKNTVTAPTDTIEQNVPWTGKLPLYRAPQWIIDLLENEEPPKVIKGLRTSVGALCYQNYQKYWTALLHVETYQEELDVHRYDIHNTTLEKKASSGQYYLTVLGLAEKRPSVLRGDKIKVREKNSNERRWFEGVVTVVELSRVLLKFAKSFKPSANARFDVQFSISRVPMRRQIQALGRPLPRSQLLFPTLGTEFKKVPPGLPHKGFFSPAIASNFGQQQAVLSILHGTSGDAPFVVFGPPGTGKTVTIIEACQQLIERTDARVLLTAPSNTAADVLCSRLGFSE